MTRKCPPLAVLLTVALSGLHTACDPAPANVSLMGGTTIEAVINQPIQPVTITAVVPRSSRLVLAGFNVEGGYCGSHPGDVSMLGLQAITAGTEVTISGAPNQNQVALCIEVRAVYADGASEPKQTQPELIRINVHPALTQVTPSSVVAGSGSFTLTITGDGFIQYSFTGYSRVLWNGNLAGDIISYRYRPPNEIEVDIPASLIAAPGSAQISVDNESVGLAAVVAGGMVTTATSLPFTITAAPVALGITTQTPLPDATLGVAYSQTIQASGGTTPYAWSEVVGGGGPMLPPGLTLMQAPAPNSNDAIISGTPTAAGTFNFTVQVTDAANPPASDTRAFSITVNNPAPVITSLSPSSALAGGAAFTLTVDGTNFDATSQVNWGGSPRTTTFVSATQITASIPDTDLNVATPPAVVIQITVVNSLAGGGNATSNAVPFNINPPPAPTPAGVLERISVDTAGNGSTTGQSPPAGTEGKALSMSADGRFVVFQSTADFDPADTNGFDDVYLRDTCRGPSAPAGCAPRTERILGVAVPEVPNISPAISGDGQWIAFAAGDSSGQNTALLVRRTAGGAPVVLFNSSNFDRFHSPVLSRDGRFIAFVSNAPLLAADPLNNNDIFLVDRDSDGDGLFDEPGATQLFQASLTPAGASPNAFSDSPAISADGRFVAFASGADDLVPNDTNASNDIFLYDRVNAAVSRVSVNSADQQATDSTLPFVFQRNPAISGDGRFIAFASSADNLIPAGQDTNAALDIFLRDTCFAALPGCAPSTTRVSISNTGAETQRAIPANPLSANSDFPALSFTGRFIAFPSAAQNLVAAGSDPNIDSDTFVRDTCFAAPAGCTTKTIIVSVPLSGGPPNSGGSALAQISEDGSLVVFSSSARSLVPTDSSTNFDTFLAATGLNVSLPSPPPPAPSARVVAPPVRRMP